MNKIIIDKNRGWRGLAKAKYLNEDNKSEIEMIFSFSQPMWDDMQTGLIILQDQSDYIAVKFDNTEALPKGQRSVLIKNFTANVLEVNRIPKTTWAAEASGREYTAICNFITNRNNHTQSDWNCIGIRVVPMI